ncbi:hypothetical protein KCU73_g13820, partial [Aureobasidium melanogenum]
WRNFGILWVYIIFNAVAAVGIYWLVRVPKKAKKSKKDHFDFLSTNMDLFYLGRQLFTALPSGNGTDVSDLPIKLLEAVVPGYSLFANVAQQWLGFDMSLVMTCIAFFFIAKRAVDFVWVRVYGTFLNHFTSSVHIDGSDELYTTVLKWIAATRPDLSKRSLTARTQYGC